MTMTSRRAVVAGAGAIPALSLSVVAPERDPTYEAIARFKVIDDLTNITVKHEPSSKSPEFPAWEAKYDREMEQWNSLRDAMLRTVPTTRAGAIALIATATHSWYPDGGNIDPEDTVVLLDTLTKGLAAA